MTLDIDLEDKMSKERSNFSIKSLPYCFWHFGFFRSNVYYILKKTSLNSSSEKKLFQLSPFTSALGATEYPLKSFLATILPLIWPFVPVGKIQEPNPKISMNCLNNIVL